MSKKKKVAINFTNDVGAECQWRGRLAMWDGDNSMVKYCMIGFAV